MILHDGEQTKAEHKEEVSTEHKIKALYRRDLSKYFVFG